MRRTTRFRQLVNAPEILVLPGVHDALSVRLAEQAGFDAITCGGYSATASLLGRPDTSLLSMSEMADMYARLCDASPLPLFADADTGFGNVSNTARAVRAYERAGVAGLFIEDQVFPKRCGHMVGKDVVPVEEFLAKLKAALDARTDPDLVIMARTDALAVHGLDEAIHRAQLAREAGADFLFVEAPATVAQMRRICAEIDGPCLSNNIESGATPVLSAAELQDIGYAVATFPLSATYAVARAVRDLYAVLKRDGTTAAYTDLLDFHAFHDIVGLSGQRATEAAHQDFAAALVRDAKIKNSAGRK